jgi:hypothetical protein
MIDTLQHIISRVDNIAQTVNQLSSKSAFSIWASIGAPLITAVIGTLGAQAIDRYSKNRRETSKDLRMLYSNAINLKIKLKGLFRQLAMYKFHAQYWWHIHSIESSEEYKNRYYLEHLRSQADSRDIEKLVDQTIADFLALVVAYERLTPKKFDASDEKKEIENLEFSKAKTYNNESADKLRNELAENDERQLRELYLKKLDMFQNIINKMT